MHKGWVQAKVNEAFHPIYEAYETVAVYGNCRFTRKVLSGFSVSTATSENIRRGIWFNITSNETKKYSGTSFICKICKQTVGKKETVFSILQYQKYLHVL